MEEFVSKAQISKVITDWIKSGEFRKKGSERFLMWRINDIPYADVRPIVFCKRCKFYGGKYSKEECTLLTRETDSQVAWVKKGPYDYCNHGKPRNGA